MSISNRVTATVITMLMLFITACGGSSDSPSSGQSTTQSFVNTDTVAYDLSNATIEAVNTQLAFNGVYASLAGTLSAAPAGTFSATAAITECGGSFAPVGTSTETEGAVYFDNYCVSGIDGYGFESVTITGTVSFAVTTTASTTILDINFSDLTVTSGGKTVSLSAGISFDLSSLTVSVEFSSGGRSYVVESLMLSVSGSGISIDSGTLVSPDYGDISISTTDPLVFDGCGTVSTGDDGLPSGGTLVMQNTSGERVDVMFNSCTEMVACYNGSSTMCDTITRM